MNRAWALLVLVVAVLALPAPTGYANLSPRQQQALTGGVAGTAAGAVLGALAGNAAVGAAIGDATGLAAGALWRDIESAL
jgi:osmotically inducible lipoprotein OsmB